MKSIKINQIIFSSLSFYLTFVFQQYAVISLDNFIPLISSKLSFLQTKKKRWLSHICINTQRWFAILRDVFQFYVWYHKQIHTHAGSCFSIMRIEFFQLREMDVIPLLLDCCNIDARNPRKLSKLLFFFFCFLWSSVYYNSGWILNDIPTR